MAYLSGEIVPATGDALVDGMTNGYRWSLDYTNTINWSLSNGWATEFWTAPNSVADTLNLAFYVFGYYANINFAYSGYFTNPYTALVSGSDINISLDGSGYVFNDTSTWALGYFPNPADYRKGDIYLI